MTKAAQNGHAPVVDMLLQAGADKELTNKVGWKKFWTNPKPIITLT